MICLSDFHLIHAVSSRKRVPRASLFASFSQEGTPRDPDATEDDSMESLAVGRRVKHRSGASSFMVRVRNREKRVFRYTMRLNLSASVRNGIHAESELRSQGRKTCPV